MDILKSFRVYEAFSLTWLFPIVNNKFTMETDDANIGMMVMLSPIHSRSFYGFTQCKF